MCSVRYQSAERQLQLIIREKDILIISTLPSMTMYFFSKQVVQRGPITTHNSILNTIKKTIKNPTGVLIASSIG